jgi:hypothetical protein
MHSTLYASADAKVRLMRSLTAVWRHSRPAEFLQLNPCQPEASTVDPLTQTRDQQTTAPVCTSMCCPERAKRRAATDLARQPWSEVQQPQSDGP